MKRKINIAVIGCGVVGLRRINNLTKNFKLVGCADPKINFLKSQILNRKKLFLTKNWKKILVIKNLNAVIISTTHNYHSKILTECIKKNLHVLIEKPGGISDVETKKILNIKKKN